MDLTGEQQKMFDGEMGEAPAQAMEILVALGKIYGAKGMVPITSVQVAGVSYKTIGDAGLEYLQDYAKKGAKVRVKTMLNPAGMDRDQWEKMKIPAEFAKKQIEVLDAYASMGIEMSCTCTPYLVGLRPKLGEHIAWSESSAISFANSVLGARTNREGGPSALAAAICGFTPNYGLHLDKNRVANFVVDVSADMRTTADFGALGAYVGKKCKEKVPAFAGLDKKKAGQDRLKVLGASMAAAGSVALYFAKGITPEYNVVDGAEEISFGNEELNAMRKELGVSEKPQLVTIGCPHASIEEIKEVADKVRGKRLGCDLWVCTAKKTKLEADRLGYTESIEKAGGVVVADTCMVVSPIEMIGYGVTATNSGKAAKYLGSMCKQKVVYGDVDDIVVLK